MPGISTLQESWYCLYLLKGATERSPLTYLAIDTFFIVVREDKNHLSHVLHADFELCGSYHIKMVLKESPPTSWRGNLLEPRQ